MRRVIVAFDTATEALAIGLGVLDDDGVDMMASETFSAPRAAMTRLLPELDALLEAAGLSRREVEVVVCGRGPGSFTGVRIAVATAKGLAHGLGTPLHGVGTLDAVAWRFADEERLLGVVGDAMRGEVYPALFRTGRGRVERLAPDRVAHPRDAAREWAARGEPITLTGNGLRKHLAVFADALGDGATVDEGRSDPTGAGLLAAWVAAGGPEGALDDDPAVLLPVYTRLSDAEENERGRAGTGTPPEAAPGSGVAGPGGDDGR